MNENELEEFCLTLKLSSADHQLVKTALRCFPDDCKSRGMFAIGILDSIRNAHGEDVASQIRKRAGYPPRINTFKLYPHLDFYRLFYSAAAVLHPKERFATGMGLVAEDFYPVFIETLAGRTMHALIGNTPRTVLGRFVEAYKIATPWCEHKIEKATDNDLVWKCKVEPCPYYETTFAGICTGMVRTVTGITPTFKTLDRDVADDHQRFSFQISW